ncbi:MAG TPA: HD domain-containing phosphohydrolase [Syntrophobacteria bacterium]|nr:HD domain-containing phosphohydrolase [Syntrophobacteria bacterium]
MAEKLKDLIRRLNQIGIALSSETHLPTLLELLVREVRRFTRADAGSLYFKTGNQLRFQVAQNDTLTARRTALTGAFRPYPIPLDKTSIAGYVAVTGETLNITDVYQLPAEAEYRFNPVFDERNDYRCRSMLVLPIGNHDNEIIGVLQLINALDEEGNVTVFDSDHVDLVASLASQAAVAIQNARLITAIHEVFAALVRYSASAIDARSPHTAGHSRRVATYCLRLARAVNEETNGPLAHVSFSDKELEELNYAAWLHDIGKIGVREEVLEKVDRLTPAAMELIASRFEMIKLAILYEAQLNGSQAGGAPQNPAGAVERGLEEADQDLEIIRQINRAKWIKTEQLERVQQIHRKTFRDARGQIRPYLTEEEAHHLSVREGNLTSEEYEEIRGHVLHTLNIINKIPFAKDLERIPLIAAAHHEKLDGSGYPLGLKAPDIMIQARILGLADVYDALTATDRPYRGAMPTEQALEILVREAEAGKLDRDLVELFVTKKLYDGVT